MMMVAPETWQAVSAASTFALAIIAAVALVFTVVQILIQRGLAKITNLEKQIDSFDSSEFLGYRKELAKQRLGQGRLKVLRDDDAPSELYKVLDFFEHVGFLVRKRHLRAYDVWHSFGAWAVPTYYDARRVIEYQQYDDPTFYDDFVWLIRKVEKISQKKTGKLEIPSDDDIYNYYLDEFGGKLPSRRNRKGSKQSSSERPIPPEDKPTLISGGGK